MQNNKFNFTKDALQKLVPGNKLYELIDTRVEGLRMRVIPGCTKTFNFFKKINGRKIRYKTCRFPETSILNVRNKAIAAIAKLNEGENLNDIKSSKRKELTFINLWDHYYTKHASKNTKRPEDNKRMLEKHVFGVIGNHKLSSITKEKLKISKQQFGQIKKMIPTKRQTILTQIA